jgi:hypothetical protein
VIVAAFISDRPKELYLDQCRAAFEQYVDFTLISAQQVFYDLDHEHGMAGNALRAFDWALEMDADYLLHIEEDMLFERPVPLREMRDVLYDHEHLAQVVLKRHAWSTAEMAAGGQMETNLAAFTQCSDTKHSWVEHSTLFSVNPCLIPRDVLELKWHGGEGGLERSLTDACLAEGLSFAYYGRIDDPPYVRHVGHVRGGDGWRW